MASRTITSVFLVIISIATARGQYGHTEEDCSKTAILKCKERLESFYKPGVIDTVTANLNQFCSITIETLNCYENKIQNCNLNVREQAEIKNAVQLDATRRMMNKICSQEFQSSLENEKCHSPIENDLLRCKANVEKNVAVATQGTELMHQMCCVKDELRKCTLRYMERSCSRKMADVTNAFLSELTQNPQCDLYKSGEELCEQYLPYISSKGNFMQPWCTWFFSILVSALIISFY